jgi:uncharacterized protein with PQ loop repeat
MVFCFFFRTKEMTKSIWDVDNKQLSADGTPPPKWKIWYARFMLIWAVLSNTFLLLQLIQIYNDKDAQGVSIAAYAVYIVGSIFWIVYGAWVLGQCNWVIVLNSSLACLLAVVVLVGAVLYRNGTKA